jgi:hypothetical protein
MNQVFDFFKPEALFSSDNPFIQSAAKSHRLFAESFDKAARAQLAFAGDLLDLNRKRIESLYESNSVADKLTAQQAIITEAGNLASEWAAGVQDIVTEYQSGVSESANELLDLVAQKPAKKAAKKAKAA